MRKLQFYWVDVFAERRFEGNQLAVFTDAGDMNAEEMQMIAREMHISETTFITGVEKDNNGNRVFNTRIFTVEEELPFAGHPTLGTSFVLSRLHGLDEVTLGLKVGNITVRFEDRNGSRYGEMRQIDPVFGRIHSRDAIEKIFRVDLADLDDRYPIQTVSTGNPQIIVPFRKLRTIKELEPDFARMQSYLRGSDGRFFYMITRETEDREAILHARMLFYGGEDPATGSAAGPAAAWLLKYGIMEPDRTCWIEQGLEMGRPSRLYIRGSLKEETPFDIRVGGYCSIIGKGEIEL